jgi:hypothetical protein
VGSWRCLTCVPPWRFGARRAHPRGTAGRAAIGGDDHGDHDGDDHGHHDCAHNGDHNGDLNADHDHHHHGARKHGEPSSVPRGECHQPRVMPPLTLPDESLGRRGSPHPTAPQDRVPAIHVPSSTVVNVTCRNQSALRAIAGQQSVDRSSCTPRASHRRQAAFATSWPEAAARLRARTPIGQQHKWSMPRSRGCPGLTGK